VLHIRSMKRFCYVWVLSLLLTSCGDEFGGASIDSLTISPSSIRTAETGMTDEFFTVTIGISGFEDDIDEDAVRVFVQDPEVDAIPGSVDVATNTITLNMIAKTWVGGLPAGLYDVGAVVRSQTESVTQRDLATITIEE